MEIEEKLSKGLIIAALASQKDEPVVIIEKAKPHGRSPERFFKGFVLQNFHNIRGSPCRRRVPSPS